MAFQEINFGGERTTVADERIPVDRAILASNCFLDEQTIRGRNGVFQINGGGFGQVAFYRWKRISGAFTASNYLPKSYSDIVNYSGSSTGLLPFTMTLPSGAIGEALFVLRYKTTALGAASGERVRIYTDNTGTSYMEGTSDRTALDTYTEVIVVDNSSGVNSPLTDIINAAGSTLNCQFAFGLASVPASTCILYAVDLYCRYSYTVGVDEASAIDEYNPYRLFRYTVDNKTALTLLSQIGAPSAGNANAAIVPYTDPTSNSGTGGAGLNVGYNINNVYPSSGMACAQLGKYFYFGTDAEDTRWLRLTPFPDTASNLPIGSESITPIPKGGKPSYTTTAPSVTKVTSLAAPTAAGGSGQSTQYTDWHIVENAALTDKCPDGGSMTYILGTSGLDWSSVNWLAVMCASPTATKGGGGGVVSISIATWNGTTTGTFEEIGDISDRRDGVAGAPNIIYCNLNVLSSATRSSAGKKIKFTLKGSADRFGVYGIYPIYAAPGYGPQKYRVTFYNSTTEQESEPTDELEILYNFDGFVLPTYHNVYGDNASFSDGGQRSIDPEKTADGRDYNKGSGLASPTRSDMAPYATITGSAPLSIAASSYDKVRLWRLTETGWRLVKESSITIGGSYSLVDDQGLKVLTNRLWKPTGVFPRATGMAAFGGRLICGHGNTITISDFTPFGQDTDPFPKFSKIAVEEADGWTFELGSNARERVVDIINGDIPYIGTSEAVYSMPSLVPNSIPYKITQKGLLGCNGWVYAEDALFWASADGVYSCVDRTTPIEVTKDVRRTYLEWLVPTYRVCLGYQNRKLYIFQKSKYLCYDFLTDTWVRGTYPAEVAAIISFTQQPPATMQGEQMWLFDDTMGQSIMRWGPSYTTDSGTAIPAWEYQTGYDNALSEVGFVKWSVDNVYMDCAGGDVTLNAYIDGDNSKTRRITFDDEESVKPLSADFAGYKQRYVLKGSNSAEVRRFMVEKSKVESPGGFNA